MFSLFFRLLSSADATAFKTDRIRSQCQSAGRRICTPPSARASHPRSGTSSDRPNENTRAHERKTGNQTVTKDLSGENILVGVRVERRLIVFRLPLGDKRKTAYSLSVIKSFRDKDAEAIFKGEAVSKFQNIATVARRKLRSIYQARMLRDLSLPGNRPEALKGDRSGRHSIRINDQYRVCFVWEQR